MKTRFSSLVNVKKNAMQKSERALQQAQANLLKAKEALADSIAQLENMNSPSTGRMTDFLANKTLLDVQRVGIEHNREWVTFCEAEVQREKEQLQHDTMEYEKFQYLELEEQKALLKAIKIKEAKDLDEIALMTFSNKDFKR